MEAGKKTRRKAAQRSAAQCRAPEGKKSREGMWAEVLARSHAMDAFALCPTQDSHAQAGSSPSSLEWAPGWGGVS